MDLDIIKWGRFEAFEDEEPLEAVTGEPRACGCTEETFAEDGARPGEKSKVCALFIFILLYSQSNKKESEFLKFGFICQHSAAVELQI